MADHEDLRKLKPKLVRARIEELLAADLSDAELRERFEELSRAIAFSGYTWLWGPELYRRNRVMFRPFISSHFSSDLIKPNWRWERVEWKKETGERLDAWLSEVDARGDADLFRQLYAWKHRTGQWGGLDQKRWQADLLERYQAAETPAARGSVLDRFDLWVRLDEPAAITLYETDARTAVPFILKHLPGEYDQKFKFWHQLRDKALAEGDQEFAFEIYRRQVDQKTWMSDILRLADEITDPQMLCDQLEKHHPQRWNIDAGMPIFRLVEKRGRDVFPYVRKHLASVYRSWWGGRDGYTGLVRLAAKQQWWDLWSALVRMCARPEEYNAEVVRLIDSRELSGQERQRRLLMLTGIAREWNYGPFSIARVQQLNDETAVKLYERDPDLLRGPFRMNVSAGWYQTYPKLSEAVIDAEDERMIDFFASRFVTRAGSWGWAEQMLETAERYSRYYEEFRDDDREFARRATNVLGQVPAFAIGNFNELTRKNRLARMFYARSPARYLAYPEGIRDLLEAPQIHAQAVAFRVLGLPDERARQLAAANIDLLLATLLRPLHRATRTLAFRALANAAVDLETAQRIHHQCREAMYLPNKRYPKENLVGLIGQLLHEWPELRTASEQPVVYGVPV
ncbi:gliding motility protein [Maioricimonas sp. JC845]|uniref:gliding motility protein n=1 Tax=Maioricimonas sp. JC845 TaxID=3232138 RepID=UPI0034581946